METPSVVPTSSSMHWSEERLHADVHRAVGGTLNLIRELSRISHELDSEMPADWMIKRAQFFAYELQSEIDIQLGADSSERERLAVLNRFFFEAKRFKCSAEISPRQVTSDAFRMSRVLSARSGAPIVMSLMYRFLAEKIGVPLEFATGNPTWFLKWNDGKRSRFIDVTKAGATLTNDELIEALDSPNAEFDTVTFERFLAAYIGDLKFSYASFAAPHESRPDKLLFLQNALIAYQPSNLNLLAERALILRKLGDYRAALMDLKRFFAFNEREKCAPELGKLHDDLVKILDRTKAESGLNH